MKFSHSLQFNAVPEWASKYLAYSNLKKTIYQLQRDNLNNSKLYQDSESQPLNDEAFDESKVIEIFTKQLDKELVKIDEFYKLKEEEIYKEFNELIDDLDDFERNFIININSTSDASSRKSIRRLISSIKPVKSTDSQQPLSDLNNNQSSNQLIDLPPSDDETGGPVDISANLDSEDEEYHQIISSHSTPSKARKDSVGSELFDESDFTVDFLQQVTMATKNRLITLFVKLSELKSFIELNKIGFTKILKKFDKSLNTGLKKIYLSSLPLKSYAFEDSTLGTLTDKVDLLIKIYALMATKQNSYEVAKNELRTHLREHIVWERNTVWRDMIGMERKTQLATSKSNQKGSPTLLGDEGESKASLSLSNVFLSQQAVKLYMISTLTATLLIISPFDDEQQKNCFALLACASLLWATETIPLFVTSLLIPLLIVCFGVLKDLDTGAVLNLEDSAKYIFSTMWSSIIMLLLGGFTLAAALTKYNIAKLISTWILSKAGTDPKIVLITIMSVALFASMWVSNVAAPVLCFSLIQPLLRTLPKNCQFAKSLILGIALSSNLGGMASPIASPQNIVAIASMHPPPSWLQWFVITIPVCVCAIFAIWGFLLLTFKDSKKIQLVPIRTIDDKFSPQQWYITIVTILTILLWCVASRLKGFFGDMGVIAIIPMVLFYGPGLLNSEDINNYPWNIVILAMGGSALGKAVSSSGLLATIAISIKAQVMHLPIYSIILIFGAMILTVATFVSHTVLALIIIPLVEEIGNSLPGNYTRIMVMASCLLCSLAMGLPTSGFPNVTAICMVDEVGVPYLTVGTFITRGVPSSLMSYFIIVTLGYGIMKAIGF